MSKDQSGSKVVLVTGGTRGIGRAIADKFLTLGYRVVITSRSQEQADLAAAELGRDAWGIGAHVLDEEAAEACVDRVVNEWGSLDVLVNNAGTNPAFGPLTTVSHDQFTKTMDTNVWAPLMWSSLAWTASMQERGGVIVNNASVGAFLVGADIGVYHASKAALVHLTRHLAHELAPRVRVNAVAPGLIRTRMSEALWRDGDGDVIGATPLNRLGEPRDVAELVTFLAGEGSSWITGETIVVDGGQLLGPATTDPEVNHD